MSAYALFPFPPVKNNSSDSNNGHSTDVESFTPQPASALSFATFPYVTGTSDHPAGQNMNSTNNRTTIDASSSTASKQLHAAAQPLHPGTQDAIASNSATGTSRNSSSSSSSRIMIAIKDAKYNPVHLIQSILQRPKAKQTNDNHHGHVDDVKATPATSATSTIAPTSEAVPTSPLRSPSASFSTHQQQTDTQASFQQPQHYGLSPYSSPQQGARHRNKSSEAAQNTLSHVDEDAIEFELAINFQGRRYTAKRTMQCLLNLREALISEMNAKQSAWLPSMSSSSSSSLPTHVSENAPRSSPHRDDSFTTKSTNLIRRYTIGGGADSGSSTFQRAENLAVATLSFIDIPELPPIMTSDFVPTTFVGRSFTMLHDMLVAYCPDVECWLRNVMSIVPHDSESLANFLFEPTTQEQENHSFQFHSTNVIKLSPSMHKEMEKVLIPILECDSDDEEDEEDEDDDAEEEEDNCSEDDDVIVVKMIDDIANINVKKCGSSSSTEGSAGDESYTIDGYN
eukprot:CAMPEP_0198123274 /NCGR_PEP_ID=MMETSP1442-20131203/37136_1 /TAXON_ID= /ORGANISM="Craspedostauros australis, Strain CCMP3328" /LENGTH=510 /DNA_ID=CAMNT_0043782455 /DNA_START=160 /DNA_END=1692 /DNA_ORIENTATION=+